MNDVIEVRALGGHRLWLRFEDASEGVVDLGPKLDFVGVFEPLRDPARFAEVWVNPDTGTIEWPSGTDLDPLVLYAWAHGTTAEALLGLPEPPGPR